MPSYFPGRREQAAGEVFSEIGGGASSEADLQAQSRSPPALLREVFSI